MVLDVVAVVVVIFGVAVDLTGVAVEPTVVTVDLVVTVVYIGVAGDVTDGVVRIEPAIYAHCKNDSKAFFAFKIVIIKHNLAKYVFSVTPYFGLFMTKRATSIENL